MGRIAICSFLRHHPVERHVGDLVGVWCDVDGFLTLDPEAPEVESTETRDPIPTAFLEGWAPGELMESWGK